MSHAERDGKQWNETTNETADSSETDSNELQMHKLLLHLRPRQYEQAFADELQNLDLLLAVMTPLVLTFYMSVWGCKWLSTVYCAVLLLKGYQVQLLLLPSARRVHAHAKFRYHVTLMERCLRQFVAHPLISSGPRFQNWMMASATRNPAFFALKTLLIVSGTHVTVGFSFANPLDIVSQVAVNTIFMLMYVPPTVCQVAIATAMLVRSQPYLVWFQWFLELVCSSIAGAFARTCAQTGSSAVRATASTVVGGGGQQYQELLTAAAQAVAVPARSAPDLDSLAGRLVLALGMWWMLFIVWFLPLYFSWRLERHFKSAFVIRSLRQQHQQPLLQDGQQQSQQEGVKVAKITEVPCSCRGSAGEASSRPGRYCTPCAVLPVLPQPLSRLWKHLGLAAVLCMAASQLFVLLCFWSPRVAGLLSKPVVV